MSLASPLLLRQSRRCVCVNVLSATLGHHRPTVCHARGGACGSTDIRTYIHTYVHSYTYTHTYITSNIHYTHEHTHARAREYMNNACTRIYDPLYIYSYIYMHILSFFFFMSRAAAKRLCKIRDPPQQKTSKQHRRRPS